MLLAIPALLPVCRERHLLLTSDRPDSSLFLEIDLLVHEVSQRSLRVMRQHTPTTFVLVAIPLSSRNY